MGSGFSGLAAAIQLQKAGIASFIIAERGPALGGTWRDNTYPGAACDIPSHLYSLASDPNPGFSRVYSPQPEIRAYLEAIADRHGLRPRLRLNADVRRCAWDEDTATVAWECADGRRLRGRFAVVAAGPLKDPKWPDIQGLATFQGDLIHSCRWPAGGLAAVAGKRVAVVGTGASAIQIIPEVAKVAGTLHVVQRTPAWVAPRPDGEYSGWVQAVFQHVPGALRRHRFLLWLLHEARYPLLFGDYPWRGMMSKVQMGCVFMGCGVNRQCQQDCVERHPAAVRHAFLRSAWAAKSLAVMEPLYTQLDNAILSAEFVQTQAIEKKLRAYIKKEIPDPQLAVALTPSYTPGCKRMLLSSGA